MKKFLQTFISMLTVIVTIGTVFSLFQDTDLTAEEVQPVYEQTDGNGLMADEIIVAQSEDNNY